ncbi:NucA/NucB deoxyribonuclease domain-containing protein [Streptomyces axinellae]|uniref:Deoxyribonuclease NucA/NucB domain-containing protein n=1 Tax=Streptomyces axinellae TaxID=552788 RepID=A0ABP6DGN6_9ACTN
MGGAGTCLPGAHHDLNIYSYGSDGTREKVGDIDYFEESHAYAEPGNSTWGSQLSIDKFGGSGLNGGVLVAGDADCPGICKAEGSLMSQFVVDEGYAWGGWLVDSGVHDGDNQLVSKQSTGMEYHFFSPNWAKPTEPVTVATEPLCCDNVLNRVTAGCVFPKHIPTMTSMKKLPALADNIRRIQKEGPHHYGLKSGGNPLSRTVNAKIRLANRNIACPKSRPRPTGKSCDEYPFASTNQGASKTTSPDWGWAFVPRRRMISRVT